MKAYLLGTDLAYFKYDDFIYVLDLVNRLVNNLTIDQLPIDLKAKDKISCLSE